MLKMIGLVLAGMFAGFTLATVILFPLLQNAEGRGRSQGFSQGAAHVVSFLRRNLKPGPAQQQRPPGDNLLIKDTRLTIIEVNGVKTVKLEVE